MKILSERDIDTALEYIIWPSEKTQSPRERMPASASLGFIGKRWGSRPQWKRGARDGGRHPSSWSSDSTDEEVQFASATESGHAHWDWAASEAGFRRVLDMNASHAQERMQPTGGF